MSDFELKENTTRLILNSNSWNVSAFEKKLHSKNYVLDHFTPWERHFSHFSRSFEKQDFKFKFSQRVRFGVENSMCQILTESFYNPSDFASKFLQRTRFCIKIFTAYQILHQKFYNVPDFASKFLQRIRFCIKTSTTYQIFHQNYYNVSDFELKLLQGVRFWITKLHRFWSQKLN